jgi:hypothetical protein
LEVCKKIVYLTWDVMILKDFVNEIMMAFTESILKIKQSNYNRSLFYAGCVDYMRHMSSVFKTSCNVRSKTILDVMFYVIVSSRKVNILLRRHDVNTLSGTVGTDSRVIGLKLAGLPVSSFLWINIVQAFSILMEQNQRTRQLG